MSDRSIDAVGVEMARVLPGMVLANQFDEWKEALALLRQSADTGVRRVPVRPSAQSHGGRDEPVVPQDEAVREEAARRPAPRTITFAETYGFKKGLSRPPGCTDEAWQAIVAYRRRKSEEVAAVARRHAERMAQERAAAVRRSNERREAHRQRTVAATAIASERMAEEARRIVGRVADLGRVVPPVAAMRLAPRAREARLHAVHEEFHRLEISLLSTISTVFQGHGLTLAPSVSVLRFLRGLVGLSGPRGRTVEVPQPRQAAAYVLRALPRVENAEAYRGVRQSVISAMRSVEGDVTRLLGLLRDVWTAMGGTVVTGEYEIRRAGPEARAPAAVRVPVVGNRYEVRPGNRAAGEPDHVAVRQAGNEMAVAQLQQQRPGVVASGGAFNLRC